MLQGRCRVLKLLIRRPRSSESVLYRPTFRVTGDQDEVPRSRCVPFLISTTSRRR